MATKKVIVLSKEKIKMVYGQKYTDSSVFNVVVDRWGNSILSEEEISAIQNPDFLWLQDEPLVDVDSLDEDALSDEEYIAKEKAAAEARLAELDSQLMEAKSAPKRI